MDWFIYTLKCPRTNAVRYVGWTTKPKQRLADHIRVEVYTPRTTYRQNWTMSLASIGLTPVMEIIETGSGDGWSDAERKWIAHYRAVGARLTNTTDGGEGFLLTKEQFKARARTQYLNRTHEQRSQSTKKAAATRIANMTPERSEMNRAIARANMARLTPEERSALAKSCWRFRTPEQRSAQAKLREGRRTPEQRRQSAILRESRKTPEQRRERASHARLSLTKQQLSDNGKRLQDSLTSEDRRRSGLAAIKKLMAFMTHDQRSAAAKVREARRTPEERSALARKAAASRTPEQRRDIALKREATKRLKRLEASAAVAGPVPFRDRDPVNSAERRDFGPGPGMPGR